MCLTASFFSRSVCACMPNRGSTRDGREERGIEGEKSGTAEEEMRVARPVRQSKSAII